MQAARQIQNVVRARILPVIAARAIAQRSLHSTLQGTATRTSTVQKTWVTPRAPVPTYAWVRPYSTEVLNVKVPSMGDSVSEGTLIKWLKPIGSYVKVDDPVCTIETDKVTIDLPAAEAGVILEHAVKESEVVKVGGPLYKLNKGAQAPAAAAAPTPAPAAAPKAEAPKAAAPIAAPAAPAPAPAPAAPKAEAPKAAPTPAPKPAATVAGAGEVRERRVAMTRMRQRIATRLKESQNTAAMLTTFNEIDMSALFELRNQYKDAFAEKHGAKLGFMSAFIKASVAALQDQPIVNAVIDGTDIVYRDYYDVSVAVASPRGLVVPVLRSVDKLSFAGVEKSLNELSTKARNDQITIEDMQGGTFTISNGGVFGSLFGTPIINPPQSAILGMHAVNKRPVVVNDQVVIRPIMYVALTYDHRLIDGREAVTFLKKIKEYVEDPRRLLLEL